MSAVLDTSSTILFRLAETMRRMAALDPAIRLVSEGEIEPPDDDGDRSNVRPSKVVEGSGAFFVKPVAHEPGETRFTHFLDGVRNWRIVGYRGTTPIVYGFAAAVIRERGADRRMRMWREAMRREMILLPETIVAAGSFREAGIDVLDTGRWLAGESNPSIHHALTAARQGIQWSRERLESQLVREWTGADTGGWLVIDGRLLFAGQVPNVVGLIKSHRTHFFPPDEQFQAFGVAEGCRTCAFLPGAGAEWEGDTYSWYQRLHAGHGQKITYGLCRVEIARDAAMLAMADRIAGWVLAERNPLAAPDERWPQMIYPIRDCEVYLRTQMPSEMLFVSLF